MLRKGMLISTALAIAMLIGAPLSAKPPGADGQGMFQLVTHLPGGAATNGIISTAVWSECATELGGRPANTGDLGTLLWGPDEISFSGWIQPHVVAARATQLVDASGQVAEENDNSFWCAIGQSGDNRLPWGSGSDQRTGLFTTSGAAGLGNCDAARPIVCAVPAGP